MAESNLKSNAPLVQNSKASRTLIKVLICLGAIGALLIAILLVRFFLWTKSYTLRAFRIPTDSMCPAICNNERIIAGMDAFDRRAPQRGEVVLFYHQPGNTSFLKRVVAVGGDTVEMGLGNSVLVNGKTVEIPGACGYPIRGVAPSSEVVIFHALTVPKDSFFVVGDNLSHSLDSRFPGFGLVRRDQIRGKALFIYWSPGHSRFGCSIK